MNTPPALASRAFALHGLVARSRWLLRLGRCILAGEVTRCRCGPVGARPPRLLFRLKPRGHSAAALAVSVLGLLYQAAKGGQQLDTPLCTGVSSCLSTQTERSVPSVESVVSLVASATAPVPCAAARLPGSYGWKLSCTHPPALASSGSLCTDWSGARNTRVTGAVLQLEQRSLALRCLAPSDTLHRHAAVSSACACDPTATV